MSQLRYDNMMKSKNFLPFPMNNLAEEHKRKAEIELNETDDIRKLRLKELRLKIETDNTIKCFTDDDYLIQFLRARKFDVERSFNLFKMFYQVKKEYPECYDDFDFDQLETLAECGAGTFLPYRSTDGCAVLLLEFSKWDMAKNDAVNVMQMLAILLLYAADDPATQVCGLRVVVNVRGATFHQVTVISTKYALLLSKALRNCMPNRFKGIHIYNESRFFSFFWSCLKVFLTEKIKKRVHFHSDKQKQLHKFIPKEVLTEEYGGLNKHFNHGECNLKMLRDFRPKIEKILYSGLK